MGGQIRRSGYIVVCLHNPPEGKTPISARLLNMQLLEFFEKLPAYHLRSSVRVAVICHCVRMPYAHVLAICSKPCVNKLHDPVAAYHGWDIKYRQPMPDRCLCHGLGLQPHSLLVSLVLLLGFLPRTASIYPLWR